MNQTYSYRLRIALEQALSVTKSYYVDEQTMTKELCDKCADMTQLVTL